MKACSSGPISTSSGIQRRMRLPGGVRPGHAVGEDVVEPRPGLLREHRDPLAALGLHADEDGLALHRLRGTRGRRRRSRRGSPCRSSTARPRNMPVPRESASACSSVRPPLRWACRSTSGKFARPSASICDVALVDERQRRGDRGRRAAGASPAGCGRRPCSPGRGTGGRTCRGRGGSASARPRGAGPAARSSPRPACRSPGPATRGFRTVTCSVNHSSSFASAL